MIASKLVNCCHRIPDGETGDRKNWIAWQFGVFKNQEALVQAQNKDRDYQLHPPFTFASGCGVEDLDFSNLGFAREAISSFSKFSELQRTGVFPKTAKFMVAIPTPFAPVYSFTAYSDQQQVLPVYEAAILNELDEISRNIPPDRLVVQWDVATEMSIFENVYSVNIDEEWEFLTDCLARLGDHLEVDIELGFHLCYGSMNNKHWKEPDSLDMCVNVSNELREKISRPINFIHMPVPVNRSDDSYFAPLQSLDTESDTEIILGLVHGNQTIEQNLERVASAKAYLKEFGIATECGLGRGDPSEIPKLMELHARLATRI
ncbi:MAG: hypothetical protein GKS01_04960 [Alphaproteobacteria bacterium]|nr:hypothetical protein [Alphaproteobacteria bacterium]